MAKKATRILQDIAGGTILGNNAPTVYINGTNAAVIGDTVAPHGKGKHRGAVLATGSPTVFANGIPMCRDGDVATCGHPVTPNSNDVFIG